MFKPLSLYIGLRYTRAKRSSYFISLIALISMLGIAIGVAVLITVLSVMNGFDEEIHLRFFGMAPHVNVVGGKEGIASWKTVEKTLLKVAHVEAVAPYVGGQGLLQANGETSPAVVSGVLPSYEPAMTDIDHKMLVGHISDLKPGDFGMVLGRELAEALGVYVGDKVNVLIPQATVSLMGVHPQYKRFTVRGIFSAGKGFSFDTRLAFIHMSDAQKLFLAGDTISGFRLKLDNVYQAPAVSNTIAKMFPSKYSVTNWTVQFGAFFKAVKMEKTMMFLILCLIIAVAAFNLISSLVMIVNDKQADIAILRTFGAMPKTILTIFIVQGFVVGLFGTILGVLGGVTIAYNATSIVNWLQNTLQVQWVSSNVYFVDYLPSKIEWRDIVEVSMMALGLSFSATLYPAWRASKTQPAEALRYD